MLFNPGVYCKSPAYAASLLALWLLSTDSLAAEFYVAVDGDDRSSGSIDAPWRGIKSSISKLRSGDTLFIREGKYYEAHIDSFPLYEASQEQRITIRNFRDEVVIVSGDIPLDKTENWEQQGNTNVYLHQPARASHYDNLSQEGVPLKLMSQEGDASTLNGEGQWVRGNDNDSIWVIPKGSEKPWQSNIAISDAHNIFSLPEGADFITIEGITVENAYYPIQVYSDDVHLIGLVVRNSYGDGIKVEGWHGVGPDWNSERGVVKNCDIYNFGESAIDVTGGDHWSILDNLIHDAAPTRNDTEFAGGFYTNGIMVKNNSIALLAEGNVFIDLTTRFGAVSLGGNSFYSDRPVTTDAIVRKNKFTRISAPYIVTFSGSKNSAFIENTISDTTIFGAGEIRVTSPEAIVQFRNGYCEKTSCREENNGQDILFSSSFNTVFENIFTDNETKYIYKEMETYGLDNDIGNIIAGNSYSASAVSFFDGRSMDRVELATLKGYDGNIDGAPLSPPSAIEHFDVEVGFSN